MKKLISLFVMLLMIMGLFSGCGGQAEPAQVAATTRPVYDFTVYLCQGTPVTVTQLVTENVSCLHDYTLQVSQMRTIESAQAVILSGAGLEVFLADALESVSTVIDASQGVPLLVEEDAEHDDHDHEQDPHIWLSPANARIMAENICRGLTQLFPEHADTFAANLTVLEAELYALEQYGMDALSQLSCRELITFHDGFAYFAQAFYLGILRAVEEESGSEASASELIELIGLVREYALPAVFTERNGSASAASVIAAETGILVYDLDMGMSENGYFDAMYHNIDTVKEALG